MAPNHVELKRYQEVFRRGGVVEVRGFVEPEESVRFAERALGLAANYGIQRDNDCRLGGRSRHGILDGITVQEQFPELLEVYARARDLAERVIGRPVILSPYIRSGINIRIYGLGSEDGWHYDSNPVSALVYFTDGGQPTEFKTGADDVLRIYPARGLLLLFDGRKLLHHVPKGDELRVSCPLNLYYPDDVARPEVVDRILFENAGTADIEKKAGSVE